jgi:hypothetical protein
MGVSNIKVVTDCRRSTVKTRARQDSLADGLCRLDIVDWRVEDDVGWSARES